MTQILRFSAFVILILSSLFAVWIGLKLYADSKPVPEYQTPLVRELISQAKNEPILWSTQSKTWHVSSLVRIKGQLQTSNGLPFQDYLDTLDPKNHLLLFLDFESPDQLVALRKYVKENELWPHTIFCSRIDKVLKDLRELEPEWSYCSGEIYMARLLTINALHLTSILTMDADVLFIHLNQVPLESQMKAIVEEGKRQNKLVLIGPVTRPMEGFSPHGWVVENSQ